MNHTRIYAKATAAHSRIRAYAFESKEPPTELQLWNVGDNPTDYGVHRWTERSVQSVWARYSERGNPLLIDVEHNWAKGADEPKEMGGYARLEIREGAPWLTFDWSAYAIEQIASRQRLFLSPEYDVDPNTNEITRLFRVSLVADPGTHRARVLASADAGIAQQETIMDPTLAAIMGILNSVADPAAAVDAIKGFVANLPGGDDVVDDTSDITEPVAADSPQKPAFAAAAPDDKETKPVAAAAAPQPVPTPDAPPVPVAASAPEETPSVKAARSYAQQSENALRDTIIMRDGHRLAPSIRQWASSQPLNVVRGLCASAPEAVEPTGRVTATRGATQGTGTTAKGLEGRDLEEMQRAMGTYRASTPKAPYTNERGEWVLPSLTPTEHRRIQAAAAAKEGK